MSLCITLLAAPTVVLVALTFVVGPTSGADDSMAWPLVVLILYMFYMVPLMFVYAFKEGLASLSKHHFNFILGAEYERFVDGLSLDDDYGMDDAARDDAWMAGEHSIFMSARLRICLPNNWDLVAALIIMVILIWLFSSLG